MPSIRSSTIFLILLLRVTNSFEIEEASKTLDQFLDINLLRNPRDSEDPPSIWLDYEFNTGAGNREELVVTDISVHEYANLPEKGTNWQFFEANGTSYVVSLEKSTLSFYKLDLDNITINDVVNLNVKGLILTFKVISLSSFQPTKPPEVDVVAVLCVESDSGTFLLWYRLVNGNSFQFFWSWPVQKHTKDMEFIQHGDRNKLLLLDDDEIRFGHQYSPIDVYGFSIDFSTNNFHFWLCQRTLLPKVFDIQVCSIYESISIAFQGVNDIFLYEYKDTSVGSIFQELQTISSNDLKNFVCFESGYLQFLAISGSEAGLFNFIEDEFQYNTESESNFDTTEIRWVKDIRLNTYRDESLLLIQLRNSTVIALSWQGLSFKRVQLPGNVLDQFDLSLITPVPRFGFILGNRLVKFHTKLKELKHPVQYTVERLLTLQRLLNDSFNHQERILDETERRLERSYLKNPTITGFWNLTAVNATSAVVSDNVIYNSVRIGSKNLTKEELELDISAYSEKLKDLEQKLEEIDWNLKNVANSKPTELKFDSDVEIFGDINIIGTLSVKDLTVQSVNDVNVTNNFMSNDENDKIEDKQTLSFIDGGNLTIHSVNGIPIENIRFGDSTKHYRNVNFSKINRAEIDGHLFFSTINGVDWETLMKNIVWKNEPAFIPGNTVIEGTLIADILDLDIVNDLVYPDDYVVTDDIFENVTGLKTFDKLLVSRLESVNTLNDIDFDDFVILYKDNVLNEEITFENLTVEGSFQIDGKVAGIDRDEVKLLNETSKLSTDVTFMNLNVLGNVTFDTMFMNKRPLDFRDLLLKTDENVEITGHKTFLNNVEMRSNVIVTSGMINGHFMDEFVTLDTDQEFPNLIKISPNVTFGNVTFGAMNKLEAFIKENANSSDNCLKKIIAFKSPITVDELSFDKLNDDISYEHFIQKLNETFQNVQLNNLTVDTLFADEIRPKTINGIDFLAFSKNLTSSNVINECIVDRLETEFLNATFINGMSLDEINQLNDRVDAILAEIFSGNATLESLRVTGTIKANSINGKVLEDLYNEDQTGTIIFNEDVSVKNLTILGLMNGFNFSERAADTVLKTDTNIVIEGHKTFDTITCQELRATSLNGRPIENILDNSKEQVLTGPVVINGSVTVLKKFNATGKIGNVSFRDLMDRFQSLDNNTYEIHGDARFSDNVIIENLRTNGSIQGTHFDSFLKTVVFKNEDNVTISGTKVFEGSVAFNGNLVVHDKLNDIDLKRFREKAVFIDKPFSIKSKIVFKDGIEVAKDLEVRKSFETKSIMGIDMNELQLNVLRLDRPAYITDAITFSDVEFRSDIEIEKFNDVDLRLIIPLHTEQIIPVEVLRCRNVKVEKIQIFGKINGEDLKEIQENTFMITGNQNITGLISFRGNVHMRHNFNPRLINGIDPTKIVPLNSKSTLIGNFVFEKPIYFNQGIRILGYLNGIDPARWEALAVKTSSPLQQIVSGRWTVHGNVYFNDGAFGSDILNGINVTELSNTLARKHLEMDAVLAEKNANLTTLCEDLNQLKHYAENQIYEFGAFDYLQIIEFDSDIVSAHHFEMEDLDYLMLSYSTCHMHTYAFTGVKFELVANVPNFGIVERWTTFRHNKTLYFLTSGLDTCGRGPVNLWKLEDDKFTHVLDLGRNVDSKKINEDVFLMLVNGQERMRSSKGINEKLEETLSSLADEDDVKIVLDEDRMLLLNKQSTYEYNVDRLSNNNSGKHAKSPEILNFKAGALEKEMFLYYDEDVSKDRIFICNNDVTRKKILQTIKAHRPSSFAILNFEGSIETLLVFIENRKNLRIYEYKGIQGFLYKDSIRMDVDKLFSFKIRKYSNVAKRYCLALIRDNRLTILEAKMHGEKLDMEALSCSDI